MWWRLVNDYCSDVENQGHRGIVYLPLDSQLKLLLLNFNIIIEIYDMDSNMWMNE